MPTDLSFLRTTSINRLTWRDASYAPTLRQAFPFFRRHAEGKYSDRTLMRIHAAADQHDTYFPVTLNPDLNENGHATLILDRAMPMIVTAVRPYSYDELTEIKTGGALGMLLLWPDTEKGIIAVHRDYRRKGVGTMLFGSYRTRSGSGHWWVGRTNEAGQHFLLAQHLVPTAINGSGAIRYSRSDEDDG